jgi:hypothetical protein
MIALVLALLPGLAHAVSKKPFGDLVALDDQRLDRLRGGLDAGTGLVVNFGFTREISINGEVVARQLLVLNDLGALLNGTLPSLQVISNLGQVVQNGPGNVVGSSAASDAHAQALQGAQAATAANVAAAAAGPPAVPAAAPATTAPATSVPTQVASAPNPPAATSGAGANTAAVPAATPSAAPAAAAAPPAAAPAKAATASTPVSASAAPAPASTAAPAAAAPAPAAAPASSTQAMTIQLPNGTLTLNLPNTNAITQNTETIVQNSMHNATIQINTALSAALNSASLARALTLAGQIRAP